MPTPTFTLVAEASDNTGGVSRIEFLNLPTGVYSHYCIIGTYDIEFNNRDNAIEVDLKNNGVIVMSNRARGIGFTADTADSAPIAENMDRDDYYEYFAGASRSGGNSFVMWLYSAQDGRYGHFHAAGFQNVDVANDNRIGLSSQGVYSEYTNDIDEIEIGSSSSFTRVGFQLFGIV